MAIARSPALCGPLSDGSTYRLAMYPNSGSFGDDANVGRAGSSHVLRDINSGVTGSAGPPPNRSGRSVDISRTSGLSGASAPVAPARGAPAPRYMSGVIPSKIPPAPGVPLYMSGVIPSKIPPAPGGPPRLYRIVNGRASAAISAARRTACSCARCICLMRIFPCSKRPDVLGA